MRLHRIRHQGQDKPRPKKGGLLLWGGLFFITLLLNLLARAVPGFAEWYARHIYPLLVGSLGRLCSLFPFSVSEVLLGACLLGAAVWVGVALRHLFWGLRKRKAGKKEFWKNSAAWAGKILAVLFFLFTVNCGINYHRMTFSQRAGFVMQKSTKEELAALCAELTEEVNEAAAQIEVDEEGGCQAAEDIPGRAREAMKAASAKYPELAGYYPRAKAIGNSWILSYQYLQGVYSPFTVEANYNRDIPDYDKPSTICHELSHLRGFMREDEANFVAYLACRASEDADFCYSGSMLAYVYSMNALYREDPEAYWQIRPGLCEQADRDFKFQSAFWDAYEGPVAEASDKLNDAYLKANAQVDGTKSYGRMVDLLLALRRRDAILKTGSVRTGPRKDFET